MTDLLSAEMRKCFTGLLFWLISIFVVVMSFSFNAICFISTKKDKKEVYNDSILYVGLIILPIIAAIFVAIFIGTEFSEGTIRSKIVAGHTKYEIYICELIVCEAVMILIQYVFFFCIYAFSFLFFGAFHHSFSLMMKLQLLGLLGTVEMTAVIFMISMLVMNKAVSISSCMILAVCLFVVGVIIYNKIEEHYSELIVLDDGFITETQRSTLIAHSYVYGVDTEGLNGGKLLRYEFFYDYLPQCQASRYIYERSVPYHWQSFAVYDVLTTIVSTFIGAFCFRRSKLK
ncbi:MAG: hypothetical protein K6G33_10275 [Ruminococcus sp.]|uniref:ABC transporter permease subunit n=1 Tax=Ruminococcus sp. TaxID=41978 RepID=UPI0025F88D88|nr:ABC transporter permease subunit [Ruminococcus sp.]MCR5601110.1 hypothetical protein [Ruminococcus sp.]